MRCITSHAQELVHKAVNAILNEQNIEEFLSYLSPKFFLMGLDNGKIAYDHAVAAAILQRHIASYPENYRIPAERYHSFALSPSIYCVILEVGASVPGHNISTNMESWFIRRNANDQLDIAHVHMAIPQASKSPYNFTREILQLHDRTSDGIAKVAYGTERQVLYMSDRLVDLFGYSREQIAKNNYRTVDYIFEEDLDAVKKAVTTALESKGSYSVRYRVRHKEGKPIWVKVNGLFTDETYLGSPIYYCVYTNITDLVEANERLMIEKERYRIITELTDGITFEYDPSSDIFEFSSRYAQYFATPQAITNFSKLKESHRIPLDNSQQLTELFNKGTVNTNTELQLKTLSGNLEWFSVTSCTLHDEQGNIVKILGKIINIHQKKIAQLNFENKSQHDLMTNLLNKTTAEHQIQHYFSEMSSSSMAAFLMIDIDNFKKINDTMGHFIGDHVLCSIAEHLRRIFRNTDILGRFGGDEFIVLMKDISDEFLVREKAAKLCQSILDTYRPDIDGYRVSLSIGIVIIQGNRSHSYHHAFQKADKALYAAKNSGKNQFCMYNEWMDTTKPSIHAETRDSSAIEFSEQQQSYLTIVNTALDILLHIKNPQDAISNVLKCLGTFLNLRKAYVGIFTQNQIMLLVQWVNSNETALPQWSPISREEFLLNFNRNGMLLCSDISTLTPSFQSICKQQGAEGLLQRLIYQNDEAIGFIGLGCCGVQRVWTQNEIDILQTISKVLTKPLMDLARCQSIKLDAN